MIEITVKPFIDLLMDGVIVIADFFWGLSLFEGFGLSCSTVLVSTTDIQSVMANLSAIPSEDISTQHAANDVTKMRHVVNVWKCRCDQDIAFFSDWHNRGSWHSNSDDLSLRLRY